MGQTPPIRPSSSLPPDRAVPVLSADDLYRERVRAAREMPPARKLALGLKLFDRARALMIAGTRSEFPNADDDEVRRILGQRLELARKLECTPDDDLPA